MERTIVCGEIYRHFKGMLYQVIGVAKHSETREPMVVYQALYGDYSLYVRPLTMFLSEVDHEKYPQVTEKYRFTKVDRNSLSGTKEEILQKSVSTLATEVKTETNTEHRTDAKAEVLNHKEKETSGNMSQDMEQHPEAHLVNSDLMAFLDAKDYAEKLEVLYSIRKKLDDRLMSDIEMFLDLPIGKGTLEERLLVVQSNLQIMAKFESRRLR